MTDGGHDPVPFIRANTALKSASLVPEVRLHLADAALELWQLTEEELRTRGLPPPFWAFAWAGGQALARHIIDHPEIVRGRAVFDLGSGSGLVAVACALAGARRVVANEIDGFALAAIRLNASANGVADRIETLDRDALDRPPPDGIEIVTAGDVCYEAPMAERVTRFLRASAARPSGLALIGDPGRSYLPEQGLERLAEYRVPVPRDLEDSDLRRTVVWRVLP